MTVHLDWNQASIDSERVCREGDEPGDYVQWEPAELFRLHDWNVVTVADGHDFPQVVAAQRLAAALDTGQPTAIVYRTHKGWHYGIEGAPRTAPDTSSAPRVLPFGRGAYGRCRGGIDNLSAPRPALRRRRRRRGARGVSLGGASVRAARLENATSVTTLRGARLMAARERLERRSLRPRPGRRARPPSTSSREAPRHRRRRRCASRRAQARRCARPWVAPWAPSTRLRGVRCSWPQPTCSARPASAWPPRAFRADSGTPRATPPPRLATAAASARTR